MVGQTILHYQIIEKLGAGGMGEIYKAQDPRLNRFVAIKVLPAGKTGDPERRRRFVQEAQAASALNHPNIITIYDILSEGDTEYMVMEFVVGRTLSDLIPRGGLRVPQVLRYSTQMADALSTAHAAGIIHRDFKPANVMVTASDLVKVLDFGLAKLTDPSVNSTSEDAATRSTAPLTIEGAIMGTVSYMSPEQAEGKRVDARSDVFAFGSVLYEMATGNRAFDRGSGISTLSAVLRDEVQPISQVAPDVPQELEQIIDRCLRKDPDWRWQSMRDVERALVALRKQSDSGTLYRSHISLAATAASAETNTIAMPPPAPSSAPAAATPAASAPASAAPRRSSKALLSGFAGVAVLLAVAGAGTWWWMNRPRSAPPPVAQTPAAVPATPMPAPAPPPAEAVLTNDSIIEMAQANVPASIIVSQIRASKTNFNFSTAEIIRMTKAGVPESVIHCMRDPNAPAPAGPKSSEQATKAATPRGGTNAPMQAKSTSAAPTPAAQAPTPSAPAPAAPPAPAPRTETPAPPAAANRVPAQAVPITVADSLPFSITLGEDVPEDAPQDQPLHFTVTEGLKVDNSFVIAKGATVTGSIMSAAGKKNIFGKGGKLTFRLQQVDAVDGAKLNVRAAPVRGTAGRLEAGKGPKSKELAAARGTEYVAYTDGQQTVSVRK